MPTINALLVRYDGGYFEALDTSSIAASGFGVRRESLLSVADMRSPDEATRVADSTLASYARTRTAVEANLEPLDNSEVPYVGFDVGDSVTVDDETDTPATSRVQAISVSEDAEGAVIWTPELGDIIEDPGRRTTRWLRRMDNGTLAGRSESAQPLQVPITRRLSAPPRGGKPYATFVVAAFDSYAPGFREADFVCNGSDAAPTINAAVAALDPLIGGRILLLEGTYPITSSILLIGLTVFEGQGVGTHIISDANSVNMVVINDDNNVTVRNMWIDGGGFSACTAIVYNAIDSAGQVVEDVILNGNLTAGIYAADLIQLRISGVDIYDCTTAGVYLVRPSDFRITDFSIHACDSGIIITNPGVSDEDAFCIVGDGAIYECNSYGIYCRDRDLRVNNAHFRGAPSIAHVYLFQFHGGSEPSLATGISACTFLGGGMGVDIDDCTEIDIVGSRFSGLTTGVRLQANSADCAIQAGNRFSDCTTGVTIEAGCADNVVGANIFRNNGADLADAGAGTITYENN